MKKVLFLSAIVALIMQSCSNDTSKTTDSSQTDSTASAKAVSVKPHNPLYSKDSIQLTEALGMIDLGALKLGTVTPNPEQMLWKLSSNDEYFINYVRWGFQRTFGLDYDQMNKVIAISKNNPGFVIGMLQQNRASIKAVLKFGNFESKTYNLYDQVNYWLEHPEDPIAKDFQAFNQKYGDLPRFPIGGHESTDREKQFWQDMNAIMGKYPDKCADGHNGFVPTIYKNWLFANRWKGKIGITACKQIASEVKKIVE